MVWKLALRIEPSVLDAAHQDGANALCAAGDQHVAERTFRRRVGDALGESEFRRAYAGAKEKFL